MDKLPLAGFTVAVTAARRREELSALLQRRGARTIEAPAIRIIPISDDEQLLTATRACVEGPLDVVVVTTAVGFRGWMQAADDWGLGDALRGRFVGTELLTRGPKARGAVRAAGLTEAWAPDSEQADEMLTRLLDGGVAGRRIAVQLHGDPLSDFCAALREAGAEVVEIGVYRWVPPDDVRPLRRLVGQIAAAQVDCVTFTSAPAVVSLLATAEQEGKSEPMLAAMRAQVLAACVGQVTAAPLHARGIPTVRPARARVAALVRTVVDQLPARRTPVGG